MSKVTAVSLLYGDYPQLAKTCLTPLVALRDQGLLDLRVGANEPSAETLAVCESLNVSPTVAAPQIYKYPMMRKLFWNDPIETEYVMWFDDDSYISAPHPDKWLEKVVEFADKNQAAMIGSEYVLNATFPPKAADWFVSRFPKGIAAPKLSRPSFFTGGWWMARTAVLQMLDWPHKDFTHRGGDVGLGIVLGMYGLTRRNFNKGVMINAGETGKESGSPRRGYDESYPFI